MRILPGAMVLWLAGCSLGDVPPTPRRGDAAAPAYRKQITANLAGIVGDPKLALPLQISGSRQVDTFKGPAWLVCLKARANAVPLYYAVFFQDDKIVDTRLAVGTDRCEEQAFEAFGALTDSQTAIR